ncbi:hypothetical protein BH11VER1_BH11VER1_25380 [soil metagenome]
MLNEVDSIALAGELATFRKEMPSRENRERFLACLRKLLSADAAILVRYGNAREILGCAAPSEAIAENLVQSAEVAISQSPKDKALIKKFTFRDQQVHLIAVPCDPAPVWLLVWLRPSETSFEPLTQIARLAAGFLPCAEKEGDTTATLPHAVLGLLTAATDTSRSRDQQLADFTSHLARVLNCETLYLAQRKWSGWSLQSAAPHAIPNHRSALFQTLLLAVRDSQHVDEPVTWPEDSDFSALGEMARLHESVGVATIPMGAGWMVLAVWKNEAPSHEALTAMTRPLVAILHALNRSDFQHAMKSWKKEPLLKRRWWFLALVGVIVLMLTPFHQRIHAPLILEPAVRRYIAAPFDSVLKKVHVTTGSLVTKGQLLAELDDREIREKAAELEAQAGAANLQSATDMAASNFAESAVSALQAKKFGHELEVLRQHEKNLQILSPIDGILVTGDLERSQGAALKLGRPILEVAPLDKMFVEVAVREEDIPYVRTGMNVIVHVHALGGRKYETELSKIQLRAETRDGRNVFISEAEISNSDGDLRPGMKGEAIIIADHTPLFWSLFRKPWNTLRGWLFW